MLRYGRWHSYDVDNQWLSFDALKFARRVQPVIQGSRYSITLYTPGKLERLTAQDWDNLAKAGFPIYLYEPLPAKMRRLITPTHVMKLTSEAKKTQFGLDSRIEAKKQSYHRSEDALDPHPDGPTTMTWHQLEDAQQAIVQGHKDRNVSAMLKGVVANMHILCKFSREAGFLPYIGHAHYIYECYLRSQINSSRPPSGCDFSTVWSLQVDLDKDLPKACSLALKPSL